MTYLLFLLSLNLLWVGFLAYIAWTTPTMDLLRQQNSEPEDYIRCSSCSSVFPTRGQKVCEQCGVEL